MINSLSTEVIKILDALCQKFGLVIDWTTTNIIPYMETLCGKIINYEIATSVVWMVLGTAICVVCLILFNAVHKNTNFGVERYSCGSSDYTGRFMTCIIIGFAFIAGLVLIIEQTFDIVTCCTLPEKLLIEEFTSIYNNIK